LISYFLNRNLSKKTDKKEFEIHLLKELMI